MPIYEYSCGQCGKVTDLLQKVGDPAPEKCEACGTVGQMTRVVSRTSFVLKGGGWYSDLYGSTKKDSGSSSSSQESAPSSAPASTSSTPASAPAAPSTSTSSGSSSPPSSGSSSGGSEKK